MSQRSFRTIARDIPILLFLAFVLGLTFQPAQALAVTHYVAAGGDCGGAIPCYATIQAAVDVAAVGDEIKIAAGVYTGLNTQGGLSQVVYINKSLTLRGGYTITNWSTPDLVGNLTTLNAQGGGRAIAVIGPADVTISGLRLTGGSASGLRGVPGSTSANGGGGVYSLNSNLTLKSCTIFGNTASSEASKSGFGGGVFASGGSLTVRDSTIESNLGSPVYYGRGGGLYINASTSVDLTDNLIQNNTGSTNQANAGGGSGGGVFIEDTSAVLTGNIITGNTGSTGPGGLASASGGGLYVSGGNLTMTGNSLSGNTAARSNYGWGGGINLTGCTASLEGNTIEGNQASASLTHPGLGGGIYAYFGNDLTLTGNVIRGNIAASNGSGWGGGIYIEASNANLIDNGISANTASVGGVGSGGGLFLAGSTTVPKVFVLEANTITGNRASAEAAGYGGGIDAGFDSYLSELTMYGNLLRNNIAGGATEGMGGGMRLTDTQADLYGNLILQNRALFSSAGNSNGGGLYAEGTDLTMVNNIVAANHAATHGAGLYFFSTESYIVKTGSLKHNTFADNIGCGEGIYAYTWSDLTISNTIISGHSAYGVFAATAYSTVDLDGTLWHANQADSGGSGAVTRLNDHFGDPAYTGPLTGNYHLGSVSAAIDQGLVAQVADDLDGQLRPNGSAPDLGADEYYASGGPAQAELRAFAPQWFFVADPDTGDVQTTLQQRYLLQLLHADTPGYVADFTNLLPAALSFHSELHTPQMNFNQQGGSLTWQTEQSLPAAQAAQILLTAVSDQLAPLAMIVNQAEASAGGWDFDLQATSQAPLYPPLISSPGNGEVCPGDLEVSGTAFPNTTVKIYENAVEKATTTTDTNGEFTVAYPSTSGVSSNVYLTAVSCLASNPNQCSDSSATLTLTRPLSFICPQQSTLVNTPVSGPLAGQTLVYRFVNDAGWFVGDGAVFNLVPPHVNSAIHLYRRSCAEMGAPPESVESVWLDIIRDDVVVATYHPSSANLPWYHFQVDMDLAEEPGEMEFFLTCEWEGQAIDAPANQTVFSSRMNLETSLSGFVFDVTQGFDPLDPGASGVAGVSVTAMMYVEEWGGWAPWPAHLYGQTNPQITGDEGQFIFLVPPGSYYLEVDGGAGYQSWRSPLIEIGAKPLQMNIPLTPQTSGAAFDVVLGSYGPYPSVINIAAGDVVQWSVEADPALMPEKQMELIDHPFLRPLSEGASDPLLSAQGFDGGMLIPGSQYRRRFTQPGTYVYNDGAGHIGVIQVGWKVFAPIIWK